ncbi:hypothetical protein HTZ77_22790 [Nonomuraea sp. SMC257]|uniref:Uncharacterized protein n=1 Tax=Nonomuraea montanisoli TaxID=2741721 RepID=A0A7Y6I9Z2_9ACTN|nr:hypothetical protein [Nonomuraea montanisoli]NUW34241.1 hypothetical protein [Nonomuraea montanisoli]
MTVRDLRDVLREHGDAAPPPNPGRHDQVRARVGRIRRRRLLATGTAVASVAAVLGVVVLPGGPDQRRDTTVEVTTPATPPVKDADPAAMPETFTAPDGTVYRRLALTSIKATGSRKATVTVPVTGKPLDVAAFCSQRARNHVSPRVSVDGRPSPDGFGCLGTRQLTPLTVPKRAGKRITVTFDTTTAGLGCSRADPKSPCKPIKEQRVPWSLAVYEWTPPTPPVVPAAPRAFPREAGGWKLAETRTGTWPGETSVTFRVRGDGRPIGLDQICTGDLARRLWFTDADTGGGSTCGVWDKGPYPMAMSVFKTTKGRTTTITLKLSMQSPAEGRPVRWSVGLFRR